jgi:hypothetical protein
MTILLFSVRMTIYEDKTMRNLPNYYTNKITGKVKKTPINFDSITQDGRIQAEAFFLLSLEDNYKGISCAIVKYCKGGSLPPHKHLGYELIYILEGDIETNDGVFKSNDLILMSPNSIHSSFTKSGCTALIIWFDPVEKVEKEGEGDV